jgi:ATP-dependent RNA helicase DDX10/DBP4
MLELLYRKQWSSMDGPGALILSPTRELAVQIFEVLRKVGSEHTFSAGLLIGGKSYEQEAKVLPSINIIVATPGRILHHLDHTPMFSCDNLQMLIIDEGELTL